MGIQCCLYSLLFSGMEFKLILNFLEQSNSKKAIVLVLMNHLRWAWYNHVRQFFIVCPPVIKILPGKDIILVSHCEHESSTINQTRTEKGTYLGTTTRSVFKYSESRMKCSFFTRSARFLLRRLPLEEYPTSYLDSNKIHTTSYLTF